MRKQINGLAVMTESTMGKKPFSGDLFLFCGGGWKILKALYWDRNGFCLWTKKLQKGRFPWPQDERDSNGCGASKTLSKDELEMILDGIDFRNRFTALKYERVS